MLSIQSSFQHYVLISLSLLLLLLLQMMSWVLHRKMDELRSETCFWSAKSIAVCEIVILYPACCHSNMLELMLLLFCRCCYCCRCCRCFFIEMDEFEVINVLFGMLNQLLWCEIVISPLPPSCWCNCWY